VRLSVRGDIGPRHAKQNTAREMGNAAVISDERRGTPDARHALMKRYDRLSVLASPKEDAERCDAEHNERENLTRVHLTCRDLCGAAATP